MSELVEGPSLAEILSLRQLSHTAIARWVARIAEALHYAHEQGFVHLDIKPANILIDEQGNPRITDFGIAATLDELSEGGSSHGTLHYMAPEQLGGQQHLVDRRVDIHALGVMLYQLLTGKLPFDGQTPATVRERILLEPPVAPRTLDASIPEQLERICLRCLEKHPAKRFATAGEVATALRKWLEPARRFRWLLVGAVAAVMLVAAIHVGTRDAPQGNDAESASAKKMLNFPKGEPSPASKGDVIRSSKKVFLSNYNQIWVMDNTAEKIWYSFDQNEWKPVTKLVKTVILCRGTVDDPRIRENETKRVFVKYADESGTESPIYEVLTADAINPPKGLGEPLTPKDFGIELPKIPDGVPSKELLDRQINRSKAILKSVPFFPHPVDARPSKKSDN